VRWQKKGDSGSQSGWVCCQNLCTSRPEKEGDDLVEIRLPFQVSRSSFRSASSGRGQERGFQCSKSFGWMVKQNRYD